MSSVQERAKRAGLKPLGEMREKTDSRTSDISSRAERAGLKPLDTGAPEIELDTSQQHGKDFQERQKLEPVTAWQEAVASIDPFMKLPTGEEARSMIHELPQASLEVADTLATGAASFFPSIGSNMGRLMFGMLSGESFEEAEREAAKMSESVAQGVSDAIHLGLDEPPKETQAAKSLEQIFITAKEKGFNPAGEKISDLTEGGEYGAALSSDALEILSFAFLLPKVTKTAKSRMLKRYAGEAAEKQRLREKEASLAEAEKKLKEAPTEEVSAKEVSAEAPREYQPAGYEGLTIEEVFGEKAARETRLGEMERLQQEEHIARQKVYDDLYMDTNMKELFDEVDAYVKASKEQVSGEAIQLIFNDWRKRNIPRVAFEEWRAKRHQLENRGIYARGDFITGIVRDTFGAEAKKFYAEPMDLKYSSDRVGPREYAGPKIRKDLGVKEDIKAMDDMIAELEKEYGLDKKLSQKEKQSLREGKELLDPRRKKYNIFQEFYERKRRNPDDPIVSEGVEPIIPEGAEKTVDRRTSVESIDKQTSALMELSIEFQKKLPAPEKRPQRLLEAPPDQRSASDIVIQQEKLKARNRVAEEFSREEKPREERVSDEPTAAELAEIEAENMRAENPEVKVSAEQLRHEAAKEFDEFMNEDFGISYESNFHESLMEDSPRPLDEMMRDFNELTSDIFRDESGHISMEKLSGEQRARVDRIVKDLQVIQRNAAKAGKRIADFLVDNGMLERDLAEMVEQKSAEIIRDKPLESSVEAIKGSAEKVDKTFRRAEKEKINKTKRSFKDFVSKVQRGFTARDIEVRKVLENDPLPQAERALLRKVNAAGAYPRASFYFEKAREKIYSDLSSSEVRSLDRFIAAMNELEIARRKPDYKHFGGLKSGELKDYVENFQQVRELSDASMGKITQAARDYFDTFHDLRNMKFEEGAIPSWLNDLLAQYDYSPNRWLEIVDMYTYATERSSKDLNMGKQPPVTFEEFEQRVSAKIDLPEKGGNFGPNDPGILRLKEGASGYKELNSQYLLASAISETHSWVMRNAASRSLGKYARLKGFNGDPVRMAPIKKFRVDSGGQKYAVYAKPPKGWKEIHYYQQGTRRTLHARDWFAAQWKNSHAEMRQQYAGMLRLMSGSAVLREFATGAANPTFFLKGFPMDIAHIYMAAQRRGKDGKYTGIYSSNPFKYAKDISGDLKNVFWDALQEKGRFKDFVEEGGYFNFLTETADVRPTARGKIRHGLNTVRNWLAYMNKTSEIMTRLSVRERAIKEGYEPWAATGIARDYLDYSQGGHVAKLIDDVIPYTNVGIQATRGLGKSAIRNHKEFAGRASWLMGTAASLYAFNKLNNPDAWDQESQFNKNNYFMITTGWSITDDRGNKHYLNFKLRKDPSQAALSTLSELMMASAMGDEPEFKRLLMSVKESLPYLQSIPLPPVANAVTSYVTNTDMLTLEKVWKGEKAGVDEWYRERTSKLWKDLGEAVGVSPERFKAASESIITSDSYPAKLAGKAYDSFFREIPQADQETILAKFLLDNWASDVISLTYEPTEFEEDFEDIDIKEAGKRWAENQIMDSMARSYYKDREIKFDKISDFLAEQKPEDRERLQKRLRNYVTTMYLEDQSMWMSIGGSRTPKAKAQKLIKWWKESDEDKRTKIQKNLMLLRNSDSRIIPKEFDSAFWKHYRRMLGEEMAKN